MNGKVTSHGWKKGYRLGTLALALLLSLGVASAGTWSAQASGAGAQGVNSPQITCVGGQCFADVTSANPFYANINNLFMDGVIGGFACGGVGEPCDAANRPYYRPANNVTRQQMTKFIDLGRRSIADATGLSLALSGPLSVAGTTTLNDILGASLFISSTFTAITPRQGVITAINNARSTSLNAGVYAEGATAVWGEASSTGTSNGYAGYFFNSGGGSGFQAGVYASSPGYGVRAYSQGTTASQEADAVVGSSSTAIGAGGVFTDTASNGAGAVGYGGPFTAGAVPRSTGLSGYGRASGDGVYAQDPGVSGTGLFGDAENYPTGFGDPSAIGIGARSYDGGSTHTGLQVFGKGLATGGFATGSSYSVIVRYNGTEDAHPGDVLALDGNNVVVNNDKVLGTTKATSKNAGAAIGVAEYRLNIYSGMTATGMNTVEQADTTATSIHPGDMVEIVVVGQAQVQVSGPVKIGDRLAIGESGLTATHDGLDSIGKVAELPDKDGRVTVFVNFK